MLLDQIAKWFLIVMMGGIPLTAVGLTCYALYYAFGPIALILPTVVSLIGLALWRVNRPGSTV
jgi:hypothetical protein